MSDARARTVLLLGATGYVGGRLVSKLLEAGIRGGAGSFDRPPQRPAVGKVAHHAGAPRQ